MWSAEVFSVVPHPPEPYRRLNTTSKQLKFDQIRNYASKFLCFFFLANHSRQRKFSQRILSLEISKKFCFLFLIFLFLLIVRVKMKLIKKECNVGKMCAMCEFFEMFLEEEWAELTHHMRHSLLHHLNFLVRIDSRLLIEWHSGWDILTNHCNITGNNSTALSC